MKIQSYNNNRYIHVTEGRNVDFWWDNLLQQIAQKNVIQQMVLVEDGLQLECATVCVGNPINCCEDSLLANNLDCLFSNDYVCLTSN
jgi:hypothetical protein